MTVEEMLLKAVRFTLANYPHGDLEDEERLILAQEMIYLEAKVEILNKERTQAVILLENQFPR